MKCEHEVATCVDCKKTFRTDEFFRKGVAYEHRNSCRDRSNCKICKREKK